MRSKRDADEVGGGAILFGVGQAAAHRVAGEKEQIGAQVVLADRIVLRRALLLRRPTAATTHAGRSASCMRASSRTIRYVAYGGRGWSSVQPAKASDEQRRHKGFRRVFVVSLAFRAVPDPAVALR